MENYQKMEKIGEGMELQPHLRIERGMSETAR